MAAVEEKEPAPKQGEARRGDGVLLVVQNNDARSLTISSMNETAENLLGYQDGEAVGRKFESLLGSRTAEFLAEEIEYADDAPDLGDVLARQREIRLRQRSGEELQTACTISRLMSDGQNARFQLVIPNNREALAAKQIRDFIRLNLEGRQQLDETTQLPNHATAEGFLPLLKNYVSEGEVEAAFAVIRLDRHTKSMARYGQAACVQLLQHAANCCRSTFRTVDVVFALSDHTLGLVLFDISRESARVVLNRLRWNIRNHRIEFGGKSDFSVTVSIGFDMLDAERGDGVLGRCETAMAEFGVDERNGLVELGN